MCSVDKFDLRIVLNTNQTSTPGTKRGWIFRIPFTGLQIFCISSELVILCWAQRASSACPLGQGRRQQMQVLCVTSQHKQACQPTAAKIIFLQMTKLVTRAADQIENTPAVVSNQQKTQVILSFESYCLPAWWQSTQLVCGRNLHRHLMNHVRQTFLQDFILKPKN